MTYLELAQSHIENLYPIIVYGQPTLAELPPGAIIGTWAYSVPGKVRFILDRTLEIGTGVLPADLARAWVRDTYKLPLRRRKNQMVRSFRAPIHARKGTHGDCTYVDIKSAYLKILSFGYDVEYLPGKYIGAFPEKVPGEVSGNKFCYSIAVAMSGSQISHLQVKGKEGLFEHKPINLYSNPCLFNLAQDVLNAIAGDVLESLGSDCVYVNTDGFIVKSAAADRTRGICEDWGFSTGIKAEGTTEIFGVGSWKVGDERTKRLDPSATDFTGPLMDKNSRNWLRTRMDKWAPKLRE